MRNYLVAFVLAVVIIACGSEDRAPTPTAPTPVVYTTPVEITEPPVVPPPPQCATALDTRPREEWHIGSRARRVDALSYRDVHGYRGRLERALADGRQPRMVMPLRAPAQLPDGLRRSRERDGG